MIVFFFACVLDVYQRVEIEVNLEIKECLYQGTAENSIEAACCCRGSAAKHLMSKQKEKPKPAKADKVVVFMVYAIIFAILLTVT